jgi:hypothetical protein
MKIWRLFVLTFEEEYENLSYKKKMHKKLMWYTSLADIFPTNREMELLKGTHTNEVG